MSGTPRVRSGRKRKRVREASQSQFNLAREQDKEMAKAVCQVVSNLVCQVSDEPYGDLSRKRPAFVNVLRKFVKDSVQAHHDQVVGEYINDLLKKHKQDEEQPHPYGIELVWGIVLDEMAKADRKERARQSSTLKAAKRREQKRKEAEEAAREIMRKWEAMDESRSCSSDDDEEYLPPQRSNESLMPDLMSHPPLTTGDQLSSSSSDDNIPPHYNKRIPPKLSIVAPPISTTSEDSDWAVPPKQWGRKQGGDPFLERANSFPVHKIGEQRNYPLFNKRGATPSSSRSRGRGVRGRGRGGVTPTVRAILDAAAAEEATTSELMARPPVYGFIRGSGALTRTPTNRGKRGTRGSTRRGRGGWLGGPLSSKDWDADAAEYQQHLLAEKIETSGDSASQESQDEMSVTINEVVARVNSMSELNDGKKRKEKKEEDEEKEEAVPAVTSVPSLRKRRSTKSVDASKSVVKKRKSVKEEEIVIMDTDEEEKKEKERRERIEKEREQLQLEVNRWLETAPRITATTVCGPPIVPIGEDGQVVGTMSSQSSVHTATSMIIVLDSGADDEEERAPPEDDDIIIDSVTEHSTIDLTTSPDGGSTSDVLILDDQAREDAAPPQSPPTL